jgi:hypothetical protein
VEVKNTNHEAPHWEISTAIFLTPTHRNEVASALLTEHDAMKAYRGSGGIASLIL